MTIRHYLQATIGFALLAVATIGCPAAPRTRPVEGGPAETGAGTLAQARQYLEGRWSLLSFEVFPPGQAPVRIQGTGTLNYDEFANLQMEIRFDQAAAQALQRAGIPNENGVVSTNGRTSVDMNARTLTYIIAGQPPLGAPSGPLATNRPRHWVVDGDVLTLTTNGENGERASVGRWQKIPQ